MHINPNAIPRGERKAYRYDSRDDEIEKLLLALLKLNHAITREQNKTKYYDAQKLRGLIDRRNQYQSRLEKLGHLGR